MDDFSSTISQLVREANKEELRKAYSQANKDAGQRKAMEDWEGTLGDGSDEQ